MFWKLDVECRISIFVSFVSDGSTMAVLTIEEEVNWTIFIIISLILVTNDM